MTAAEEGSIVWLRARALDCARDAVELIGMPLLGQGDLQRAMTLAQCAQAFALLADMETRGLDRITDRVR